jgi:hypothetical protein
LEGSLSLPRREKHREENAAPAAAEKERRCRMNEQDKREVLAIVQEAIKPLQNKVGFKERRENQREQGVVTPGGRLRLTGGNDRQLEKKMGVDETQDLGWNLMEFGAHGFDLLVSERKVRKITIKTKAAPQASWTGEQEIVVERKGDKTSRDYMSWQLGWQLALLGEDDHILTSLFLES